MSRAETRIQLSKFIGNIDEIIQDEVIAPDCWEYAHSGRPHAGILSIRTNKFNSRDQLIPNSMKDIVANEDWIDDNY